MMKNSFLKYCIFLWMMTMILSCSTSTVVKFQSSPSDAEVSVIDTTGVATVIGKTPLNSTEIDVFKNSNRHSQVRIKKEGFLDNEIILMKSTFGSEIAVNVQLKKDETVQNIGEQSISQEKVASSIARANGLIQSKNFIEAESVMTNFVEQFPSVSVGFDYLGNIYFLQKKYAKALKNYWLSKDYY
ncbi:MAG: hypothetical protein HOP07_04075 [Bacteriovoracaceae bacterium]|nr:hypothetical protein [Bacteriovoracaceae bacterium]